MVEQTHHPEAITELSTDECWELLERNAMGHLAYAVVGEPGIVPINYLAREGRILFRTAEGSKLLGVTINSAIAFEVDEIGIQVARTVIVKGTATQLQGAEATAADELPLRPWVPTLKYNVVEIVPSEITGRAFKFEI